MSTVCMCANGFDGFHSIKIAKNFENLLHYSRSSAVSFLYLLSLSKFMEKFEIMCMSKAAFQDIFRVVIGIMQVFFC
jgi:hypothetical protein